MNKSQSPLIGSFLRTLNCVAGHSRKEVAIPSNRVIPSDNVGTANRRGRRGVAIPSNRVIPSDTSKTSNRGPDQKVAIPSNRVIPSDRGDDLLYILRRGSQSPLIGSFLRTLSSRRTCNCGSQVAIPSNRVIPSDKTRALGDRQRRRVAIPSNRVIPSDYE